MQQLQMIFLCCCRILFDSILIVIRHKHYQPTRGTREWKIILQTGTTTRVIQITRSTNCGTKQNPFWNLMFYDVNYISYFHFHVESFWNRFCTKEISYGVFHVINRSHVVQQPWVKPPFSWKLLPYHRPSRLPLLLPRQMSPVLPLSTETEMSNDRGVHHPSITNYHTTYEIVAVFGSNIQYMTHQQQ